jgi:hypothetical protein
MQQHYTSNKGRTFHVSVTYVTYARPMHTTIHAPADHDINAMHRID